MKKSAPIFITALLALCGCSGQTSSTHSSIASSSVGENQFFELLSSAPTEKIEAASDFVGIITFHAFGEYMENKQADSFYGRTIMKDFTVNSTLKGSFENNYSIWLLGDIGNDQMWQEDSEYVKLDTPYRIYLKQVDDHYQTTEQSQSITLAK